MCDLYWFGIPGIPNQYGHLGRLQCTATNVAQDARRGRVAIAHPTHQPKAAIKPRLGYHSSVGGFWGLQQE